VGFRDEAAARSVRLEQISATPGPSYIALRYRVAR
jgi:hypothetical protein